MGNIDNFHNIVKLERVLPGLVPPLNVVAAAAIVATNKILLHEISVPAPSAALTFCHYCITTCYLRIHGLGKVEKTKVPRFRVFLVCSAATLGVASGNMMTLQLSSVSFHQISLLASLPGGLIFDFILFRKVCTLAEFICVAIVAVGVIEVSRDDKTTCLQAYLYAMFSVFCMLSCAIAVRRTCKDFGITSTQWAYLAAPWGATSAGLWWLIGAAAEMSTSTPSSRFFTFSLPRKFPLALSLIVALNCMLAVVVNVSSAWCAANCSTLLYGVLGQAKTLCTIIFGAFLLDTGLPFRQLLCMITSLMAVCIFLYLESRSKCEIEQSSTHFFCSQRRCKEDHWIYITVGLCFCLVVIFFLFACVVSTEVIGPITAIRNGFWSSEVSTASYNGSSFQQGI